jgi:hypothetical protein
VARGKRWRATKTFTIRNVSTRRLIVNVAAPTAPGSRVDLRVRPSHVVVRVGRAARIAVTASASPPQSRSVETGLVSVTPIGGQALHLPWAAVLPGRERSLLTHVTLDRTSFAPSDVTPAVLRVRAGQVLAKGGTQIVPVSELDVMLYRPTGRFVGRLTRLRDLLPGTYSFGITGRGPSGVRLPPGRYELRIVAWPVLGREPSRARVRFEIT